MKERNTGKAAPGAAFLFTFWLLATAGHASINISPLRVELSDGHDKDVILISNQDTTTKSYEVEVVAWSQTDERREVYSPTDDILAVPPLFSVAPGEEQVIRVGMLTDADPNTERSYRMFITELASPEESEAGTASISMRLRIGVPVFIAPNALPSANLQFVESQEIGEQLFVRFRNSGNTRVKVTEVHYTAPGSADPVINPMAVYFLAGQTGLLPIEIPGGQQAGNVKIVTEQLGVMEYELPFAP